MSTAEWVAALRVFGTYPELLIATILIACAVVGLAWWLGGQSALGRIDVLKDRLKPARLQYNDINTRLSDLINEVAIQQKVISELLSNSAPERVDVEELAHNNTKIQNALTNLATSASHLGHTLTLVYWAARRSGKRRISR